MILHRFRMALLGYLGNSSFGKNSNISSAEFHLPQGKGKFSSFLAHTVGSHHLLSVSVHMWQECTGMELVDAGPGPHSSPHPSTPLAPVPLVVSPMPHWVFLLSWMMQRLPLDHSCGDGSILGLSGSYWSLRAECPRYWLLTWLLALQACRLLIYVSSVCLPRADAVFIHNQLAWH